MFERKSYSARRRVDPPIRVHVWLGRAYPPTRLLGQGAPMWVMEQGLQYRERLLGDLTEWWLTSGGDWLGRVTLPVVLDGEQITLDFPIPEFALEPEDRATYPRRRVSLLTG